MPESHVLTSSDFSVRLHHAATGAQVWQFGPVVANSRCVAVKAASPADDHIYVGSSNGVIHKLKFQTGAKLGQFSSSGIVWGLTYADGVVYANSGNTLQAFHSASGHLWTQPMDNYSWGDPVVSNGIVYSGSWDGKLYAINTNGTPAWISTEFNYFATEPAVDNGVVYATTSAAQLVALDAATGAVIWATEPNSGSNFGSPVAVGNGMVFASAGGPVRAFDAATGAQVWSGKAGGDGSCTYWNGRVYIADGYGIGPGHLKALDASTGALLWVSQSPVGQAGGFPVSRPTVDEGTNTDNVFVTSGDGFVYAFNRDTGLTAWSASISGGMAREATWTDAQTSPTGGGWREYSTIDPLALRLSNSVYVKLKLPYPQPREVAKVRLLEVVKRMSAKDQLEAMAEIESLDSLVTTMKQTIGELGIRDLNGAGALPDSALVMETLSREPAEVH